MKIILSSLRWSRGRGSAFHCQFNFKPLVDLVVCQLRKNCELRYFHGCPGAASVAEINRELNAKHLSLIYNFVITINHEHNIYI